MPSDSSERTPAA